VASRKLEIFINLSTFFFYRTIFGTWTCMHACFGTCFLACLLNHTTKTFEEWIDTLTLSSVSSLNNRQNSVTIFFQKIWSWHGENHHNYHMLLHSEWISLLIWQHHSRSWK
jgi:hypothetical protein